MGGVRFKCQSQSRRRRIVDTITVQVRELVDAKAPIAARITTHLGDALDYRVFNGAIYARGPYPSVPEAISRGWEAARAAMFLPLDLSSDPEKGSQIDRDDPRILKTIASNRFRFRKCGLAKRGRGNHRLDHGRAESVQRGLGRDVSRTPIAAKLNTSPTAPCYLPLPWSSKAYRLSFRPESGADSPIESGYPSSHEEAVGPAHHRGRIEGPDGAPAPVRPCPPRRCPREDRRDGHQARARWLRRLRRRAARQGHGRTSFGGRPQVRGAFGADDSRKIRRRAF